MPALSFCGASVTGFSSSLGWGQNKSSLDVQVIEDVKNGDFFNPPPLGMPCYFYFGASFHFWGILQSWQHTNSDRGGYSQYSLKVEDPRELLMGTQLILNNYHGSTFGVPNILNCYAYWEDNLGYGGANANSSGMPWFKIAQAVQLITNLPAQGLFGGPIYYRGVRYAVDLSLLPIPPPYYRVGGGASISLMQAIQTLCDESGCDFFVELDPGVEVPVIRVFTVSRYLQPPLGTIKAITNNNWGGTVCHSDNGVELRNDPTTSFLIGGDTCDLHQTDAIQPFWGYNLDGSPTDNMAVYIPGMGYCNGAFINIQEIADCFNNGANYYFLTEFEMRAAIGGSWPQYVKYESFVLGSDKYVTIGPLGLQDPLDAFPQGFIKQIPPQHLTIAKFIKAINQPKNNPDALDLQVARQNMVEDFVKQKAEQWYGKKFWVSLPFVTSYTDPDTLEIKHSHEVTQGGWLPEGATPLGLSPTNLLKFMNEDTTYESLAIFWPIGIDLENANPQDSAWEPGGFYTKVSIDKSIFVWPQTGIPAVVVTVNTAVTQRTADVGADLGFMGVQFQQDGKNLWKAFQGRRAWGAINIQGAPTRYAPTAIAVPLKSNISTYGPWYLAGPPGKVVVEQMNDLTPWNYGGIHFMNLAAQAKVVSAVTLMQVAEKGSIELVGLPLCPLGRQLLAGGPEVTNIEVHYGSDRITTNYRFQSFTGTYLTRFNRTTQERLKILGRTTNEIKKSALLALASASLSNDIFMEVGRLKQKRYPKWQVSWSSPSPVFISSAVQDEETATIKISTAVCDPTEGWTGIGALRQKDDNLFENSALCGISAIVRPFANNPNSSSTLIPKIIKPADGLLETTITVTDLNPYQREYLVDLDYLSAGTGDNANYIVDKGIDWSNIRGVAIKAPLWLSGWGYDIHSNISPTSPTNSATHNVGPVDLLWDDNRGVWTPHSSLFGILSDGDLPAHGSIDMTIMGTNDKKITVYNLFNTTVKSGSVICVNWQPYMNLWAVIAADCPTS
jgi:hypothetical protein